jgi:ABC-type sulfate/molybdate transport systems ATPase subunit
MTATQYDALEINGVWKAYAQTPILRDVQLSAQRGRILALIGPSGAGKSTLLKITAGVETADKGRITLPQNCPAHFTPWPILVWQNLALFEHMTVRANVGFGLRSTRCGVSQARARVQAEIARFALSGFEDAQVSHLSGGERQRVALARAFAMNPATLLLDEPFTALDSVLKDELRNLLRAVAKDRVVILVTHNREDVYSLAHSIAVLDRGQIQTSGPVERVFSNPPSRFLAAFSDRFNLMPTAIAVTPFACANRTLSARGETAPA